jgi:hypothetical protein
VAKAIATVNAVAISQNPRRYPARTAAARLAAARLAAAREERVARVAEEGTTKSDLESVMMITPGSRVVTQYFPPFAAFVFSE